MEIVKKTLCDMVPKAMSLFIVQKLGAFIQHDLLKLTLKHLEEDENFVSIKFICRNYILELVITNGFIY